MNKIENIYSMQHKDFNGDKRHEFLFPRINVRHKYNQRQTYKKERSFKSPQQTHNVTCIQSHQQYQQCDHKQIIRMSQPRYTLKKSNSQRKVKQFRSVIDKQNIQMKSIKKMTIDVTEKRKPETKHQINLSTKVISTKQKPPHRYKTTILIFKHCMLLYGGLGCEKNLTWARLLFQTMNWQIPRQKSDTIKPINMYSPCSPIYGHTMVKYKDTAIIYGGSCNDQINQLTLINTKTMTISQGARCPFRRKQHAASVLNDLMIIHGGIQARQTKNQLFAYSINNDKWIVFNLNGLPALSSHKMVKGKSSKQIYLFGGINSKGKSTNKLYRIKNITNDGLQLKIQQIQCSNSPSPRHSFCFQKVSANFLLLYGGREQKQTINQELCIENGVFNDIQLYNIQKRAWKKVMLNIPFQYCFGMASTSANGTVFIYGGSTHSQYVNADISLLWNSYERNDPWESVQGSEVQICSSKKISNKFII